MRSNRKSSQYTPQPLTLASSSSCTCALSRKSGNAAMMRPATLMSRFSTVTSLELTNASMIGRNEYLGGEVVGWGGGVVRRWGGGDGLRVVGGT